MKDFSYLIIGNGQISRHIKKYFSLKKIPCKSWQRNSRSSLERMAASADIIVLLITDSNISGFINENPFLKKKNLVHFSGALNFKNVLDMHPLAAFSKRPFSIEEYEKIPFISSNPKQVKKFFPKLKNPVLKIKPSMKPLYHALCVLGGNFPAILWFKALEDLEKKFKIPRKFIFGYLEGNLRNFMNNPEASFTGPLRRNDEKTMRSNLKVLGKSPFADVYRAFKKTR
ncbi:MAG: DUF2520 domain-containing protein [Elusimicrobiales bacterium]|nr:DUF2520 domain-containing protein [Elusimicrobiales bacterium]MCK5358473.1 DUF2520 domain-containing protein [Elusimicrobiales bacterium]